MSSDSDATDGRNGASALDPTCDRSCRYRAQLQRCHRRCARIGMSPAGAPLDALPCARARGTTDTRRRRGPEHGQVSPAVAVVVARHGYVAASRPTATRQACRLPTESHVPDASRRPEHRDIGPAVAVVVADHGNVTAATPRSPSSRCRCSSSDTYQRRSMGGTPRSRSGDRRRSRRPPERRRGLPNVHRVGRPGRRMRRRTTRRSMAGRPRSRSGDRRRSRPATGISPPPPHVTAWSPRCADVTHVPDAIRWAEHRESAWPSPS